MQEVITEGTDHADLGHLTHPQDAHSMNARWTQGVASEDTKGMIGTHT